MPPDPVIEVLQTAKIAQPELSVIVPAHNAGPYITQCLQSILAQPGIRLELVVINDASTDSTLQQMHAFTGDPRITLLNARKNLGASGARNGAIKFARARWLCPFDADDVMFQNSLVPYFHCVTTQPDAFWGYCGQRFANAQLTPTGTDMCSHFDFVLMLGSNMVCHGMSLFRKESFDAVGGYDPAIIIGQDYDLFLRFLQLGDPIFYNRVCYFYRRHDHNSNNMGHKQTISHHERMNDAVHQALEKRLHSQTLTETPPRIINIAAALTLLKAAIESNWPTVLECNALLTRAGISSLWKDHLTATALTATNRHREAFAAMAPWLQTFNDRCDWNPHEVILIIQRTLQLARNARLEQQYRAIQDLARQIAQVTAGTLLARQLSSLAG
jgi:hypothetical protein